MSGRLRAVFRCDASEIIGGGHAMRCLTLADALSQVGVEVMFVAAAMPEALAQRIKAAGHRLERIPASPELRREGREWEEPPLSDEAQLADANATGAAAGPAEWVVVDHYLLDARWHSAARTFAGQILVIDDLANRSHDCEVLLDQTFGRSAEDYRGLVSSGTKVLAGANYALLRSEFSCPWAPETQEESQRESSSRRSPWPLNAPSMWSWACKRKASSGCAISRATIPGSQCM
jgi:UDP-2,4-diacetamido-2,4,6-trideoxy-beta-L-altropyranose hydrolase